MRKASFVMDRRYRVPAHGVESTGRDSWCVSQMISGRLPLTDMQWLRPALETSDALGCDSYNAMTIPALPSGYPFRCMCLGITTSFGFKSHFKKRPQPVHEAFTAWGLSLTRPAAVPSGCMPDWAPCHK